MRLALVTTDFPPAIGGTQTYALELATRMHTDLDGFVVVAPEQRDSRKFDELLPFRVRRVASSANLFPIRARGVLRHLFKDEGFDSAFCVAWPSALACMRALDDDESVRIFCAAHGRELLTNPWGDIPILSLIPGLSGLYPGIRQRVLRRVDVFFPVSHYTGGLLRDLGVDESRIRVHGNGTDPNRFYPEDGSHVRDRLGARGRPIILTVARLVKRKGVDTVLQALEEVRRVLPEVLYIIGGTGPDREYLGAIVNERGLEGNVHFEDRIPYTELRSYYNACDVFVMPARESVPDVEGFGIVFLEAGACGKPVIGARSGGIPDAVIENVTGLLVEPDDHADLAGKLIELLIDKSLSTRLGGAGLDHVLRQANWNIVARNLIDDLT
jgi:phosphatidyl-myo-inositol dimannoside synthase